MLGRYHSCAPGAVMFVCLVVRLCYQRFRLFVSARLWTAACLLARFSSDPAIFPEPSAYRQQRKTAEQAHAQAGEVGLRQPTRQLGIHRATLTTASARWELPPPERRVGWLVYGLLTASLGLLYAFAVLVLGQLFSGVGGNPPSWAIAGATLAVAALVQPARPRIQAAVDRRFNRRKYNAARTVEAFGARLREEVDLDMLSAELLAVVDQTMQPSQV
jgi:hypothetical protein